MTKKTENALKKPLDQVLGFVMDAVAKWRADHTEKVMKDKVTQLLNKNAEEMTLKLLGFNNRWGNKWEIDHCNGRAGESAVGDYMRKVQSEAIKEFFDSLDIKTVITPALRSKLIKIAQEGYASKLEQAVRSAVTDHATKYANRVVEEMTSSDDLEKVIKTMHLLDIK